MALIARRMKRVALVGSFLNHLTSRLLSRIFGAGLLALCAIMFAACGSDSSLPSGVYTNQQYHFRITYPAGWQVNTSQQSGANAPLIVIITRSGARNTPGSIISSLTIDVLALDNAGGTQVAAQLANDKTLTPITLSGQTAYHDKPSQQQGAGNESAFTVTHSDYYLVHGAYEYQISVDALAGDESALDTMAQTFTILT